MARTSISRCSRAGGHDAYLYAYDTIVRPQLHKFKPDLIVVACGYDASVADPLSRMMAGSNTFQELTRRAMEDADALCGGKLAMTHEGGYSEVHVPFCGHAVLAEMSGSSIVAEDPFGPRAAAQQPSARADAFHREIIDDLAAALG